MAQGKRIGGTGTAFVKTAQQLSALAAPPPPPPGQLSTGRQRLLAEAARMDTVKAARPRQPALRAGNFRLAGALLAAVLIMGLAFVGRAAADSLPGTPLYGLKLVVEQARMGLTTDAEHRAELAASVAQERLQEIATLLEQGQAIDGAATSRATAQLASALAAAKQLQDVQALRARERLLTLLQTEQEWMLRAMSELPEAEQLVLQELLREMERVRQELHTGQGAPSGEQNRMRLGTPQDPAGLPGPSEPPTRTKPAEDTGPGPGSQPSEPPSGPKPPEDGGPGPGSDPSEPPAGPKPPEDTGSGPESGPSEPPAGPKPPEDTGSGPGSGPSEPPAEPKPPEDTGPGSGSQPSDSPAGPEPAEDTGPGSGSQPSEPPSGPSPAEDTGSGSGSQPSEPPSGPDPAEDTGSGSGSQPSGPNPTEDTDPGSGSQPSGPNPAEEPDPSSTVQPTEVQGSGPAQGSSGGGTGKP